MRLMKLKHYGLLTMLGLLTLSCSDDNEQFSGGDGQGQIQASFGADYKVFNPKNAEGTEPTEIETVSPDVQNFSVHLAKNDGTYDKTWASVSDFPMDTKFSTGTYTMEIWYGDIEDEGFEKPYYYGSSSFDVIDEEIVTPSIEARLGNTMVSLTYTEAFKNYFLSYSAKVRTSSGASMDYTNEETRPLYVKPGKVSFLLQMTKTNGTEVTLEPAAIENAEACTHYRVTFDVNGGEVGDAVLSVTFDDATEQEPIEVILSEELMNAPAPVITSKGFTNETPINIIEGDNASAQVAIVAQSGIAEVTLNTVSDFLASKGWASEIELMGATTEQKTLLEQCGLSVKGLWNNPDKMAMIDFSGVIPNLSPLNGNSTHKFTVQVKDIYGRVAEKEAVLVVNAPAVIFTMSEPLKSEAGSQEGTFLLTFNGNMENVSFKAQNDYGVYVDAPIKTSVNNNDGTYLVTVAIPDNASTTSIKGYYKGVEKSSVTVKIGMAFTLTANDYDVWATKAILKLNAKTPEKVLANLKSVNVNDVATTNYTIDEANKTFTINGMTPGSQNTIKIVADDEGDDTEATVSVATEVATQLPNSDMESWTVQKNTISGKTYYNFLPYTSGNGTEGWWATNNQIGQNGTIVLGIWWKGCFASSTSYTADAHGGNRAAYIFTNGHGHKYASTGEILYADGAYAGSLFVGSFNYNSSASDGTPVHGHAFTSRPSSMSFWYKYTPKGTDTFKVWVALKNGDETIAEGLHIPTETSTSTSAYTQATVNFNYLVTNKKATSICVQFLSTTKASFSGSDFNKKVTINYPEVGEWVAHRGSELWIDDIQLNY